VGVEPYDRSVGDAASVAQNACHAFDTRDWETYAAAFDEAAVYRSGVRGEFDRDTAMRADRALAEALDPVAERDHWVSDGELVAWRWRLRGAHRGGLLGVAESGQQIDFSGATIARVRNGRTVELETFPDALTLMRQLGVSSSSAPRR
jgi:predicted ester cyclase